MAHKNSDANCRCPSCICIALNCEERRNRGRVVKVMDKKFELPLFNVLLSLCDKHAQEFDGHD